MSNLLKITIIIFLTMIFPTNQAVFSATVSSEEILLPRVDLIPKEPCPVAPVPKTVKKSTVTPGSSLLNYTANFKKPYDDVFIAAVTALEKSPITVVSFDSTSGRIVCNYHNRKAYGLVESTSGSSALFKITPVDCCYNIPLTLINGIFHDITATFNPLAVK
jgi:hypothetical protein